MSLEPIIEEYIYELCRAIGDAYEAINNGIGSVSTPGTALYEVGQLNSLAKSNIPYFGILRMVEPTDPTYIHGFTVNLSSSIPPTLIVDSAKIAYNNNVFTINEQSVSYARTFADNYDSASTYGVVMGFSMAEAQKISSINSANVTSDTISGYSLPIDDISIAVKLGFPLQAQVETQFITIIGVDGNNLILDLATELSEIRQNTTIYFLYKPQVKCICGLPVGSGFQSDNNASIFSYYPPIPDDWLPIGEFLVTNPVNPQIIDGAFVDLVYDWTYGTTTQPVFVTADANIISEAVNTANMALLSLKNNFYFENLIQAIISYTSAISSDPSLNFKSFWGNRPFKPTSYFTVGTSFNNLERFEFPDSFVSAYYDSTNQDLQHTFGVFRGDLYQNNSSISGLSTISGYSLPTTTVPSTLQTGTYIYGITAVYSNGQESSAVYIQNDSLGQSQYINEILSTANTPVGSDIVYYHIYRRGNIVGEQIEYRITNNNQIASLMPPSSSIFPPISDVYLGTSYNQSFVAPSDPYTLFGGVKLSLQFDNVPSNGSDGLGVTLCADNSGVPGVVLGVGTSIPYSAISVGNWGQCVSYFTPVNLQFNTKYWIVMEESAQPRNSSSLQLNGISICGFLDNGSITSTVSTRRGVMLTGNLALVPTQIRVLVPQIDLIVAQPTTIIGTNISNSTVNDLIVIIIAQNGKNGTPSRFSVMVPANTLQGTVFDIGTPDDVFDRVIDMQVSPGNNLQISNGVINWSIYDLVVVETKP